MNQLTLKIMDEEDNIRFYPLSESVISGGRCFHRAGHAVCFAEKQVWKTKADSMTRTRIFFCLCSGCWLPKS